MSSLMAMYIEGGSAKTLPNHTIAWSVLLLEALGHSIDDKGTS
jgi:hypothetical protein